jgi:RNA polymerase sigma factor (sigma-70 family)
MRDDPSVAALVARASGGDQRAWDEIVERYAPLVWTLCTRYQLSSHDIEDVGQTVWLSLVEQLGRLREPAALPGWLATTTNRECIRVVTAARKSKQAGMTGDDAPQLADDKMIEEEILIAERDAGLRAAFAQLPPACQRLLSLLFSDPPRSYAQISAELGMRLGSVGPQRARCLERLRRSDIVISLGADEFRFSTPGGETGA